MNPDFKAMLDSLRKETLTNPVRAIAGIPMLFDWLEEHGDNPRAVAAADASYLGPLGSSQMIYLVNACNDYAIYTNTVS